MPTDDIKPGADILPFRRREPIGPERPVLDFECRLYERQVANDPHPLVVGLEHHGRLIGTVAAFEDSDEGRAHAQIAADAVITAIQVLYHAPPTGGSAA